MCEDWVGQGCNMWSSAEGLNSDPCMRIEGTVASKISRHRKLRVEGYYGPGTGPLQFLPPRSRPLSCAPLLCRIARAYGIASIARRFTLP
jgi:hypothetical protein